MREIVVMYRLSGVQCSYLQNQIVWRDKRVHILRVRKVNNKHLSKQII